MDIKKTILLVKIYYIHVKKTYNLSYILKKHEKTLLVTHIYTNVQIYKLMLY